ncbi:sigma-54 interaction domain-containing protein [Calderihabitans maritimus]|uniref:PAS modulated Fis family sigma-54-specific transcriptional regulator n=1 Tax=Calderihabitans maritimus TaxID=1246530 RepID=A0A1Z5HS50_9FIRM|nr:sigma-54-dependent Fis family transcriptional regulator [Calderihabitans maritimus]GAW92352.1 PAS modulated Fis family sigma-54-specific transcriptional regulator [Calderihabitans maritimus]
MGTICIGEKEIEVILNSTHEGIIAVNREGKITVFNQAAEKLIGVSAEEALGRDVTEVVPNTRLPVVLKTGKAELNQQQRIGDTMILTNRVPVRDENGAVVGVVAVFRDISEIVALAERITRLRETQMLLEAIINSTQDAISVVDESGLQIMINPAYTQLTGLTEKDVLGKPATVDIAEGESMHMRVLKTRQPVRAVPMKVGPKRREVLVDAAPIIVNNELKGSVAVIHDISEIRRLSEELERARRLIRHLEAKYTFDDIVGVSVEIREAIEQAKKAAETPATVVLRGESGTGKELFAHAIHQASKRSHGPFIRVSCAAIPDTLLESELFGYVEGAFTGARRGGRRGYFQEASGGTLFLDEIGEMGLGVQSKLLRVLQEKEVVPVGDSKPVPVDVRVIAATNANLEELVKKGKFREDLYYRLNVITINIPPLRYRKQDIPHLVHYLLRKFNQEYGRNVQEISPEALQRFLDYSWPGNVRELENVLSRAIINMKVGETRIEAYHLPPLGGPLVSYTGEDSATSLPAGFGGESLSQMRDRWEKEVIQRALGQTGGNKTAAARLLRISIRSLYNKLEKHGLK